MSCLVFSTQSDSFPFVRNSYEMRTQILDLFFPPYRPLFSVCCLFFPFLLPLSRRSFLQRRTARPPYYLYLSGEAAKKKWARIEFNLQLIMRLSGSLGGAQGCKADYAASAAVITRRFFPSPLRRPSSSFPYCAAFFSGGRCAIPS